MAKIPLRGVVEGFYGQQWTQAERLRQFPFYSEKGLNAYIYAPKDDLWHRSKWREQYPEEKLQELRELILAADKYGIDFIFAVSPGLDLQFDGVGGDADRLAMLHKLDTLYKLGVRHFAVFFDDIKNHEGKNQAIFLNWLNAHFVHSYDDIKPLLTVPTEYFLDDMLKQQKVKPYTANFAATLDKDIIVLYTGHAVVPEGISLQDMQVAQAIYGTRIGVWWNYPVSDYLKKKLALGPVHGLDGNIDMAAFFMNPMEHAELSKLSLATGADFAQDPLKYDEESSWQQALNEQYGVAQAKNMALFAAHSQRMETTWAHTGRPDALNMRKKMDCLWQKLALQENAEIDIACLDEDFRNLEQAATELLNSLPPEKLRECRLQLQLLKTLAITDRTALAILTAALNENQQLARKYYNLLVKEQALLRKKEKEAAISEKTARSFVTEAILWYETKNEKTNTSK